MPSLYVHIPFCKSRCIYCDFFSTTALPMRERYVQAVCKEMEERAKRADLSKPVSSVYLGGGTPSQLTFPQLTLLFHTIQRLFPVAADAEVTMELNPDDVTTDFVDQLRSLPVNRVSLGIQTFSDQRLRFLHRRHTAQQAVQAVRLLQTAGYANISIDLMFGFPDQTIAEWQADIAEALRLDVQHISAYSLMYEEGTQLTRLRDARKIVETDEDCSRQMYEYLIDALHAGGYGHYEISNFCRPGFHSRHNSGYWDGTHYLGFGAAAHSYDGNTRSWNPSDLTLYIIGIEENRLNPEKETLTKSQLYDERIMTGLRTARGVDLHRLKEDFGQQYYDYCLRMAEKHLNAGLLSLLPTCTSRFSHEETLTLPHSVSSFADCTSRFSSEDTLPPASQLDVETRESLVLTRQGLFVSDDVMSDLMYL